MTKEEYIKIKQSNPTELIYIYYRSKFDVNRNKPELSRNSLMMYIQAYANINIILNYVIAEFDAKFDIRILLDANGNYIKSI